MYNDLLTIGPLTVHGYGLMIAIGVIAAYFVAEKRAAKVGLDPDALFGLTVCAVVEELDVSQNMITHFDVILTMKNLKSLNWAQNIIKDYGPIEEFEEKKNERR